MSKLFIDFETYSEIDLISSGSDLYAKHPSTEILCLAYSFDTDKVFLWLPGDCPPKKIIDHINGRGIVVAHNLANFEILIWNNVLVKHGFPLLEIECCEDTQSMALAYGLPASLDKCAQALKLRQQKDMVGHRVMMQLCKPKKINGPYVERYDKINFKDKYLTLYNYCKKDVQVEKQIYKKTMRLTQKEKALFNLDYKINRRGVAIDYKALKSAIKVLEIEKQNLDEKMRSVTFNQVSNCSSVLQITKYLNSLGVNCDSIAKQSIEDLLLTDLPESAKEVLLLRKEAAKTSTAKLQSMADCMGQDFRVRGLFQYYGTHTGRWAGRKVQLQNLRRPEFSNDQIEEVFSILKNSKVPHRELKNKFNNVLDAISNSIRGFLIPKSDHNFIGCDFSAIEARVLAWLAGEEKILDVFRKDGKIYELSASDIYNKKIEDVTKEERQIGKVAVLALGYQGGVGAFQQMAKAYGIKVADELANKIKNSWRLKNRNIVNYWAQVGRAAKNAALNKGQAFKAGPAEREIIFKNIDGNLFVRLPSGRCLVYQSIQFKIIQNYFGSQNSLCYMGYNSMTKKYELTPTYEGKLVENITQAVARDILGDSMLNLEHKNFHVVMHIHDEIVVETMSQDLETVKDIMRSSSSWAKNLPIDADGWVGRRYQK